MHIFIDDSGDGGFKFESGSSSHLVMAACVFKDPSEILRLKQCMESCAQHNGLKTEFKYAKTKERVKDCFFNCTADIRYNIRAIVMDKSQIYSGHLRNNPAALKSFAIRQLLSHGFGTIHGAKVVIDGQDTKAFGITDHAYLMAMANRASPGTIAKVEWADSKQNVGIQLADMVAGAIQRGERTHKKADPKHLRLIRPRSYQPNGSYWNFR
ncbi:DUF3800 domain-containing protein [Paenarthrobacter sp. YIM B13468]|uniref:DUF3800 domain-containing protein n=1 Tax=Paenarthrobacter sp. YIM B13468 TaxID=3366295 RepID=UPI00366FE936